MGNLDITIGNVEILALSDMNVPYPIILDDLWPDVPEEKWGMFRELYPETFEGPYMRLEIGCYLIRSGGQTILMDTGYGPGPIDHIGGYRGRLMADLSSKKVNPAEIDVVFISHLHYDHVGWNTVNKDGVWTPTFPNAKYIAHQADLNHFRKPELQFSSGVPYISRYIEPLVNLGVFETINKDTNITEDLKAIHTPGHTPGHMSLMVTSLGQSALIQGDAFVHPSQITNEDWNSLFDTDSDMATDTRRKLLNIVEADNIPMISCHFETPGVGYVIRSQSKRYWQSAEIKH